MAFIAAKLPAGWTGNTEDIRVASVAVIGLPKHHNAWGALTRKARLAGYLKPTGQLKQCRDPQSHARDAKVYRRTTYWT